MLLLSQNFKSKVTLLAKVALPRNWIAFVLLILSQKSSNLQLLWGVTSSILRPSASNSFTSFTDDAKKAKHEADRAGKLTKMDNLYFSHVNWKPLITVKKIRYGLIPRFALKDKAIFFEVLRTKTKVLKIASWKQILHFFKSVWMAIHLRWITQHD